MTWVKLSDTFAEDPRLEDAGADALALHVAALCYCARQLTDGRVPTKAARRLWSVDDPAATIARLVDVGLWRELDDGYELVDYLVDQRSREHVEEVRAKRAAAGARGGTRSGEVRRAQSEATTKQVASPADEPRPGPSRPDEPPTHPEPATSSDDTAPLPGGWDVFDEDNQTTDGLARTARGQLLDELATISPQHRAGLSRASALAGVLRPLLAAGWTPAELAREVAGRSLVGARDPAAVLIGALRELSARRPPAQEREARREQEAAARASERQRLTAQPCDEHGGEGGTLPDGQPRCAPCRHAAGRRAS